MTSPFESLAGPGKALRAEPPDTNEFAGLQRMGLARLHAQAHGAPVLVHCALGYSRSALVAAAWLLQRGEAQSVAQAVAQVKSRRPHSVLPASSVALLAAL